MKLGCKNILQKERDSILYITDGLWVMVHKYVK
jgi:hypothetical protein